MKMSLKAVRTNKNLTQTRAGVLIGVSRDTICRWEKGYATPKQEYIDKICDVYDVAYDDLIFLIPVTQNA